MDKTAILPIAFGLLRHLLTAGGGVLVAVGVLDENQLEPVIGAVLVIAGVIWSAFEKRRGK